MIVTTVDATVTSPPRPAFGRRVICRFRRGFVIMTIGCAVGRHGCRLHAAHTTIRLGTQVEEA